MSHQDLTQAAIAAEFAQRATSVTYNGEAVQAIFRQASDAQQVSAAAAEGAEVASLVVLKIEVPDPEYPDKAVIDNQTWTVTRRLGGGGAHTYKLELRRRQGRVRL